MLNTALRIEGGVRSYELSGAAVRALKGVDLSIERGDLVAVTGRSGSGKSTLLNVLGCLDRLDAGRVWIDGVETSALSDDELSELRGQRIGFVFQAFHLIPSLTIVENVLFPVRFSRHERKNPRARALSLLSAVGLDDLAERRPSQLSGGQRQRVAIARALMNEPAILLADEPTGNLDSVTSEETLALFQQLNHSGQTIVIVTHDENVAAACKRRVTMRDGQIE
jgi:putative ABC transport system ATP-binding protein